jgi:hypothetical protein
MYRNIFRNKYAEGLNCADCVIDIVERKAHLKSQHPMKGGAYMSEKERNAAAEVQHVQGGKIASDTHSRDVKEVRRKTRSDDAPHQMDGD